MSEEELKPCPFCGGKAEFVQKSIALFRARELRLGFMKCTECGLKLNQVENWTEDLARRYWNTRKPIENIVEQLEELQQYHIYSIDDLVRLKEVKEILKRGGVNDD